MNIPYSVKSVMVREGTIQNSPMITSPGVVMKMFKSLYNEDRESFHVIILDTKKRVIGNNLVSIGTLDSSLVHPREVFKLPIMISASSIMVVHNHPGGDPTPSLEDKLLTKRLVEAGKILGIPVIDHIIIGEWNYSFMENGNME